MSSPFRCFRTSPEIIHLAVMRHIRFPLSLRIEEDLLDERGIDICHETVRFRRHRFGPMFAVEIRTCLIDGTRSSPRCGHRNEVFVKVNGERGYLWRAIDHGAALREPGICDRQETGRRTSNRVEISHLPFRRRG
jgi:putative transposase